VINVLLTKLLVDYSCETLGLGSPSVRSGHKEYLSFRPIHYFIRNDSEVVVRLQGDIHLFYIFV